MAVTRGNAFSQLCRQIGQNIPERLRPRSKVPAGINALLGIKRPLDPRNIKGNPFVRVAIDPLNEKPGQPGIQIPDHVLLLPRHRHETPSLLGSLTLSA